MPVGQVLAFGCAVAETLGDLHGELSPGVIDFGDGRVKVHPASGDRARFAQYASPEKLLGKPVTAASDVFSLGAILFHALAGRPPFRGDTPTAMVLSICSERAPDLRPLRPDVPDALAMAVERALAKDPAERFASPAELGKALKNAAGPAPRQWPGRRLLAADDDAPIRELVSLVAQRVGVDADILHNGREVIDALKARRYDIALLDLNMPRMDGWAVLDFLRAHYELKPRRLFLVTGFRDQNVSAADIDLVDAVLYKPVAAEELGRLLTACLGGGDVDMHSILRETTHRKIGLR